MSHSIDRSCIAAFVLSTCLLGSACSNGGGTSYSQSAQLVSIAFPDPNRLTGATLAAGVPAVPAPVPLNQQIVLTFDGNPNPDDVTLEGIQIATPNGVRASGSFEVQENKVIFTPTLPREQATAAFNGGAGLAPGIPYNLRIGPNTWDFVGSCAPALLAAFPDLADPRGVLLGFTTTGVVANYSLGLEPKNPRLVRTDPPDGAIDVSPNLYTDPDGLFSPRRSFHLWFDAPINPHSQNLEMFQLVDLDDRTSSSGTGLLLGVDVEVVSNDVHGAAVEITPSGILPFGHLLSLEFPRRLPGIALASDPGEERSIATTFTIAEDPGGTIRDTIHENFDTANQMAAATDLEDGQTPAAWDERDSNVLQPRFDFSGSGKLGSFRPIASDDPDNPTIIVLDTSRQVFPLFDGSTPEVLVPTIVEGGSFDFTDIEIPAGVVIEARGRNPLVLNATGEVKIAGEINVSGRPGTDENSFDSSITANPGGPGGVSGGRGGEGQPTVFSDTDPPLLISPQRGGPGWGPFNADDIGGQGGECGMMDHPDDNGEYTTDYELDTGRQNRDHALGTVPSDPCQELTHFHNNGYKPPGGGGGSFRTLGQQASHGFGNVRADGKGGYTVRRQQNDPLGWKTLLAGLPGASPFPDENANNNFIGARGEIQTLHGGQGGGAGGSALDSYYCGFWCKIDQDSSNNDVCVDERESAGIVYDSEGDARGGSGGGGAGAFRIRALGPITIQEGAVLQAIGGDGGSGEAVGCGNWAGGGGGGSGGAILLQSGTDVLVEAEASLLVDGGLGAAATDETNSNSGNFFEGLAFDATGDQLYAVAGDRDEVSRFAERLHTLDQRNALWTARHPLANSQRGDALAFRPLDGLLYYASGPERIGSGNDELVFQKVNPELIASDPDAIVDIDVTDPTILASNVRAIAYSHATDSFYWIQEDRSLLRVSPQGQLLEDLGDIDHDSGALVVIDGEAGERLFSTALDRRDVPQGRNLREIDLSDVSNTLLQSKISINGITRSPFGGHGMSVHPKTGKVWALLDIGNQGVAEDPGYELVTLDPETGLADAIGSTYRYFNAGSACSRKSRTKIGSGGHGGDGVIQLQVPGGQTATVSVESQLTEEAWADPDNSQNPVTFGRETVALSQWFDMGRVIRRAPDNTNPTYTFRGLLENGFPATNPNGDLTNPRRTDIRIDYLGTPDPDNLGQFLRGQEPRPNHIPPNTSVKVEFQGAQAIAEGSKEIGPRTEWTSQIQTLNHHQFLRYRITLNIETDEERSPALNTPFPTVQSISVHVEF